MIVKKRDRVKIRNHPMSRRFEDVASALALEVLSALKGEVPTKLKTDLLNRDYLSVVSARVDPSTFTDAGEFADAYLACEMMSKFPSWDIGIDRASVAFSKFIECEQMCAVTNRSLVERRSYVNGVLSPYTPESILSVAREKIRRLLGPFSWDHAERYFGFGPGATTSLKSRHGDAYFKYKAKPCTTRSNAVLAYSCISRIPQWFSHCVSLTGKSPEEVLSMEMSARISLLMEITEGNRVITVPKNAKTDRIIAIEPTMNSYVQKGIGGLIRSRLKRCGVDLDDQSLNQSLAKIGSETDSLATIDLSSASDTVSLVLVEELLPPDWVIAIKQARSPVGILPDGTRVEYQKVSSMGNACTFELESLIFWGLTSAVMSSFNSIDRRFAVYGDDIICPSAVAHSLIWVLNHCGFSCNEKKTFVSGAFRESCGKHYFNGVDVTPIYIRKDIDSPERAIWFANQIRRYSRLSWGLDGRFFKAYSMAVSFLPSVLRRPSISDGFGDAALIGDFSEVIPQRLASSQKTRGYEGYQGTAYIRVSDVRQFGDVPYLVRQLDSVDRSPPSLEDYLVGVFHHHRKDRELALPLGIGVSIPCREDKWRTVKVAVAQWRSYGPWLGVETG